MKTQLTALRIYILMFALAITSTSAQNIVYGTPGQVLFYNSLHFEDLALGIDITTAGSSNLALVSSATLSAAGITVDQTWYNQDTDQYDITIFGIFGDNSSYQSSFLGFDLYYDDAHHYGWMRTTPMGPTYWAAGELVDWAYESTPNTPIAAGAVPEPGALALLGMGAALLIARSRRCAR